MYKFIGKIIFNLHMRIRIASTNIHSHTVTIHTVMPYSSLEEMYHRK